MLMTAYELLLNEAKAKHLAVSEKDFKYYDGLIIGKKIGIRKGIESERRKADILAEEIGHSERNTGNILDQSVCENRKQELQARKWAYDKRIGLEGIVSAFEAGCKTYYDTAEYLEVSEEFLRDAVKCYNDVYGVSAKVGNYIVYFEPSLLVLEEKK